MKINGSEKFKEHGGDYVVLLDYYTEGLVVHSQHHTLKAALDAIAQATYQPATIVKLVDFDTAER